jgi:F0F1-type ATP synthase membrane subunit a
VEHPYLFFVKLFEFIGLGHFAHAYPHVIYSWVVMLLLVGLGFLGAKGIAMVPTKMQNLFEIIVSGIEDFMVDITGEEGRWLFPLVATIFVYIFIGNLIHRSRFPTAHGQPQHHGIRGPHRGTFYARYRCQIPWHRLYQTLYGAGLVDGALDFHH